MTDQVGDGFTVGEVARLAHVSVRTLHHYDAIGLVRPTRRTATGYRSYDDADLTRLHQVLTYRRLGFALDQIAALLDDPGADAVTHLRRQRQLLLTRQAQLGEMLAAIDKLLEARAMHMSLTPQEQFEVFGTDKVGGEWAEEAEQRWGETAAYRESQRRTASYTKQDWARLKSEADDGLRGFADSMRSGLPASGPEARELAEQHRQFLTTWFYDCGYAMHRQLGEMYVADPRFTQVYDVVEPGLAAYVRDAIVANADAQQASPD